MFHAVSKILFVFSTPIFWVFCLFLFGFIVKSTVRKKQLILAGFFTFYFFSNGFVFDEIVSKWEPEMNKIDLNEKYEVAVVLGGYSTYAPQIKQINFAASSDRINAVLPLYHAGQVKKILLTGGPGNLFDFHEPESQYTGKYLNDIGVKNRDIIIEPKSRNTYQNAVETKKVLDSLCVKGKILLVTSTTHMIRSAACFKKQGIQHDEFRVDGLTGERKFYFDHLFIPNAQVLWNWNVIIHEWMGLITYKIFGYT